MTAPTSDDHPADAADSGGVGSATAPDAAPGSTPGSAPGSLPPDPRVLRTIGRSVGELVLAGIVASAVTGVGLLAIDRTSLPAFTTSNMAKALTTVGQIAALAVLAIAVLLLRRDGRSRRGKVLSWAGLSAFATITLAVPLSATRLYLLGISVDQEFRTQFLTRMTTTEGLHDMNYADLPSYYPGGWFWIGGRLADLLSVPGWEMYKPYAIGSLAVAIVVAGALWSRIIRADLAVLVTTAQAAIVLAYGSPEAYGAIVAVLIPPVMVLAWSGLRAAMRSGARPASGAGPAPGARRTGSRQTKRSAAGWGAVVATGIFLGLSATLYTLYTAFAAFAVVLMALAAVVLALHRHARTTGQSLLSWQTLSPSSLRLAAGPLARLLVAGVLAGLIALTVWAPYLLRSLQESGGPATAMHYLPGSGAELPLPMLNFSLVGALCMAGTLWVVLRFRDSVRAQALGLAVGALYLWVLLSMAWTVLGSTLLGFRLEPVLLLLLGAAGVFCVVDVARWAIRRARLYQVAAVADRRARQTRIVIVTLGVIGAVLLAQSIPKVLDTEISVAYSDTDGYGDRADHYPPGAASHFAQVDETIMSQVPTPRDDTVILTTDFSFLSFYPYLGFQAITSHYANPLGDFAARNDAIRKWTEADTAEEFVRELDESPWRPPQAFVLRSSDDGYTLRLSSDVYPNDPNVKVFTVTFPKQLFDDPAFTTTEIGPFAVIVRQ